MTENYSPAFKYAQEQVNKWTSQFDPQYWSPLEILARLTEENGELARELNHRFGPKKKKFGEDIKEVGDEISDMLFTLFCLANSLHIDLDSSFNKMMQEKQYGRDANRYQKK